MLRKMCQNVKFENSFTNIQVLPELESEEEAFFLSVGLTANFFCAVLW